MPRSDPAVKLIDACPSPPVATKEVGAAGTLGKLSAAMFNEYLSFRYPFTVFSSAVVNTRLKIINSAISPRNVLPSPSQPMYNLDFAPDALVESANDRINSPLK